MVELERLRYLPWYEFSMQSSPVHPIKEKFQSAINALEVKRSGACGIDQKMRASCGMYCPHEMSSWVSCWRLRIAKYRKWAETERYEANQNEIVFSTKLRHTKFLQALEKAQAKF